MLTRGIGRRLSLIIVTLIMIAIMIVPSLPVQAFSLEPVNSPFTGITGTPVTIAYEMEIESVDLSLIYRMDLVIAHSVLPGLYRATFADIPTTTSSLYYSAAETGGGPGELQVVSSTLGSTVYLNYSLTWTPTVDWPGGTYNIAIYLYSGPTLFDVLPLSETISLTKYEPSIIECTWQTPDDGDDQHNQPGTQVLPPLQYGVAKDITLFAIVHQKNPELVTQVNASLYYPDEPPKNGAHKQSINLEAVAKEEGVQAFETAYNQGLVVLEAADYTAIMDDLENYEAMVYAVETILNFCDPAGDYRVSTTVTDIPGGIDISSDYVYYVPMTGFEIDFGFLSYGQAEISTWEQIVGDADFETSLPTIRNVGNTNVVITITQDDMGLGINDVTYMARLGYEGTMITYTPNSATDLPEVLGLSETQSLDFWIKILRAFPGNYAGSVTITGSSVPFDTQT